MYGAKKMDHAEYQQRMKSKTDAQLKFIIKDANEALEVFPETSNADYYADEINYASDELNRRRKALAKAKPVNWYGVRYYTGDERLSQHLGFKGRLLPYRRACAVVRWLKARGIEAYTDKYTIYS